MSATPPPSTSGPVAAPRPREVILSRAGATASQGGSATRPTPRPQPTLARDRPLRSARSRRLSSRVPAWVARLVFLLGLISIASGIFPRRRAVLDFPIDLLPPLGLATVSVLGIAIGFGLMIMASGLRHRKRRAWRTVVTLLTTGVVVHIARGENFIPSVVAALLVCVLLVHRDQFVGQGDPRSRRTVPLIFVATTAFSWLLGCLVTQADRDGLVPGWTWTGVMLHSAVGLIGITGPVRFVSDVPATHNALVLLGLGIMTVVVTVAAFLRSTPHLVAASPEEQAQVRALVARHGDGDSLSYFSTRQDKSVTFSRSGKAAVTYRVISGVCLASGDPIGDVEAWPGAIQVWIDQARRQAWIPAVLGASETGAEAYRRSGLDALEIGDEAILLVNEFTLDGRAMRSVRQAVTRARRSGHTTTIGAIRDLDGDTRQALIDVASQWRSASDERGFSMTSSRFCSADDPEAVIATAHDADGRVVGLLQFVPWGTKGWSLDVMLRAPDLDSGVMEMIIADVVTAARDLGLSQISLNFAVFRASLARGERIGAGPFLRAWVSVLLFASRWWQIASLYRANAKLRPTWEPRFVCFGSASDLPSITFAALQAEGFLTLPRVPRGALRRLRIPRRSVSAAAARPLWR